MNFTNNPYEKMMKQKPRPLAPSIALAKIMMKNGGKK